MSTAMKLLPDEGLVPSFLAPVYAPKSFAKYPKGAEVKLVPEPPPEGYEARLCANKARLRSAMDSLHISHERQLLIAAMAMQESNTMSPFERDWTKDANTDGSDNHSIFNLNSDFIFQVTHIKRKAPSIDRSPYTDQGELMVFVNVINKACDMWPIYQMLAFHRGGGTTNDSFKPGSKSANPAMWAKGRGAIDNYIQAIKTIIMKFEANAHLRANELRVNIDVVHLP
jgi:hypothetical protein